MQIRNMDIHIKAKEILSNVALRQGERGLTMLQITVYLFVRLQSQLLTSLPQEHVYREEKTWLT